MADLRSKGPIIFPFKSIGQQILTINRNQLVQHNSHIAILAATSVGIRHQPCIPSVEEIEVPLARDDVHVACPMSSLDTQESSTATTGSSPSSSCQCAAGASLGNKMQESAVEQVEEEEEEAPPEVQHQNAGQSMSSVSVQLTHCTAVPSNGKPEQSVHLVVSAEQVPQPPTSQMQVSNLDAYEYLQWQWEKLVQQLDELDIDYPDGSSLSMSEFADELASTTPMTLSEGALRLHNKAKDLGCQDWANRFILLIGHRILTISKGPLFLALSPEEVCEILGSDYLDVVNERSVFRAANRWLDHDSDRRSQYTPYVLGCVRYGLMPKEDLVKYVVTRRRLKEGTLTMPPFQRSLTNGLIWMAIVDMELDENFPEFAPTHRIHSGLLMHRPPSVEASENFVVLPKGKGHPESSAVTPHKHDSNQEPDSKGNGGKKKAIQLVSQVATLEMNMNNHAGRRHGLKGGRFK